MVEVGRIRRGWSWLLKKRECVRLIPLCLRSVEADMRAAGQREKRTAVNRDVSFRQAATTSNACHSCAE